MAPRPALSRFFQRRQCSIVAGSSVGPGPGEAVMRPDKAMRFLIIGTFLLAAACAGANAQRGAKDPRGRGPAERGPATLADLLDQPDWGPPPPIQPPAPEPPVAPQPAPDSPAPRPRVDQMPPRPPVDFDVVRDLQAAIDERNRIVDQADLFDTMATILREEQQLLRLATDCRAALVQLNRAADLVGMLTHPGANQVAEADKANARQALQNAQANHQAARGAWQQQMNVVGQLHAQIRPAVGPWMACYWRMRRAIQFDRRDPNRASTLKVLEDAVRARGDFYEGRVLAAILQVYDGNAGAAEDHLKQACDGMLKFSLFGTPFANDCCHAYLLLGRPDMVEGFVAVLRKLDPGRQTAVRCWLVGLSGMLSCEDNEAATYLQKALAKVDVFKKDKDVPAEAAALLGDAALFRLTANNEAQRDVDKARQILDKTPRQWDAWQVLRARAALAAADGNWADARTLLGKVAEACPPNLAEEIAAQRGAYAEQKPWTRPRPAKPAPPRT